MVEKVEVWWLALWNKGEPWLHLRGLPAQGIQSEYNCSKLSRQQQQREGSLLNMAKLWAAVNSLLLGGIYLFRSCCLVPDIPMTQGKSSMRKRWWSHATTVFPSGWLCWAVWEKALGLRRHGNSSVLPLQQLRKMPHWYFCSFVSICDSFTLQTNPPWCVVLQVKLLKQRCRDKYGVGKPWGVSLSPG